MNINFVYSLLAICLTLVEARLIPANKTKTLEGAQTDHPNPSIRQTRDIDEALTGISNEGGKLSEEFLHAYNTKKAQFMKSATNLKKPQGTKLSTRIVRDLKDEKRLQKDVATKKETQPLVKKPIPKFNDLDYEEELQTRMVRGHTAFADSSDHEDEDFNLDDYDFDVNHDEFAGRGKPLEPRRDEKRREEQKSSTKVVTNTPSQLTTNPHPIKQRSAMPANSAKITDYYDESDPKRNNTKPPLRNNEKASIRTIRSWNLKNIGHIASNYRNNLPSIPTLLGGLPFMPQFPYQLENDYSYEPERVLDSVFNF